VLLTLASGQSLPLPGEMARAGIVPARGLTAGIVVPADAIQVIDGHDAVFVRTAAGFTVAVVQVGARSAGRALILSGLAAGVQVATRNAFLLKAEWTKGAGDDEE
jgi:cobalt-zinc-cadmium efflux system membrane fusion protein